MSKKAKKMQENRAYIVRHFTIFRSKSKVVFETIKNDSFLANIYPNFVTQIKKFYCLGVGFRS